MGVRGVGVRDAIKIGLNRADADGKCTINWTVKLVEWICTFPRMHLLPRMVFKISCI